MSGHPLFALDENAIKTFQETRYTALRPGTDITLEVLEQNSVGFAFWQALGFGAYARTLVRAALK